MVRQVQPLRVSKTGTPSSSPNKMANPRPLSEIGSTERRRNSPSYNQATRKMIVTNDSSPYVENSSFFSDKSPRTADSGLAAMSFTHFDTENTPERSPSPSPLSPTRRASLEKLKQASRVKTSNIFALESKDAYDPNTVPMIERPSANRPMSAQLAKNTFKRFDSLKKENSPLRSPQRQSQNGYSSSTPARIPLPSSPQKESSPSPTKSSLARSSQFGQFYDPDSSMFSEVFERAPTPKALNRHSKNVTFHEDPPVVNEYEQQTPEPSVSIESGSREGSWDSEDFDEDPSFDRGSSADPERDDSFDDDLENADKTPVVLPEDWSRMSPDEARTDLVDNEDDVFDDCPSGDPTLTLRSASNNTEGESRPLPPIPGLTPERSKAGILGTAAERVARARRSLPSPPKRASCSKDDILKMASKSSLSLEDRWQLMGLARHEDIARPGSKHSTDTDASQAVPEELTITNLDTGERMDLHVHVTEAEVDEDSMIADLAEFAKSPPRISRESILRKVRNSKEDLDEEDGDEYASDNFGDNSVVRPSYTELAKMHPDDPIPSRENSKESSDMNLARFSQMFTNDNSVQIKEEPRDDAIDMAAIPDVEESSLSHPRSPSRLDSYIRESSVIRHQAESLSDEESEDHSRYSSLDPEAESTVLHAEDEASADAIDGKETLNDAMGLLTVTDYSKPKSAVSKKSGDFMGLPAYLSTDDYDFGLNKYITPSPPPSNETTQKINLPSDAAGLLPSFKPLETTERDLPRPTYDGREYSPPGTPDSVLCREYSEWSAFEESERVSEEATRPESPAIPERKTTIRTGNKLKSRPSAGPADLHMMAERRRLVSAEHQVPPIPAAFQAEVQNATEDEAEPEEGDRVAEPATGLVEESKVQDGRKSEISLEFSHFEVNEAEDGLNLEKEFDRVVEHQEKGYLMRQNTKLVVASNRNFSNESNETANSNGSGSTLRANEDQPKPVSKENKSPRKPSAEQVLKTEPWNGKVRRKSQRFASNASHRNEPAPPLPGQPSALGVVDEDFATGASSLEEDVEDGVERGRLFVKVVNVKKLDLPMPKNDRIYFQLTLDNGLHCVTTSRLELGNTAPIGQEFELVVLNDLEFQLTLTTKLPPPPVVQALPASTPKNLKSSKNNGISRFLTSPKKRAERERLEREAAQAEEFRVREEAQRKRAALQPTTWDLLHELVNSSDGSFARAYVNLKAHENGCFGRPLTVDVPCYNEWALEKDAAVVDSVRNKRGGAHAGPVRKPPYIVGHLELQLLYVPKPKEATDDEMPKSMSGAIREMFKASEAKEVAHEGYLSQQGGDCAHWRRRLFRLQGPKFTAYHEHTNQKRAVINLAKASRLVDDKRTLVADPKSTNPSSRGARRKSAFAEEDEAYQYVEEGFRLRFANGETIDFYADSRGEKDQWMNALSQVIGKTDPGKKAATWTDLVLARERVEDRAPPTPAKTDIRDFARPLPERKLSERKPVPPSKRAPTSPVKSAPERKAPMPPVAEVKRPATPPMNPRRGHRSRDAVKSMIF